ncbi:mechanosensitive ion channel family protein [Variovorax terrae]|uniref:Mechanosensitive ion channel n=1 Tax=Variovorax terrae TaxID=2923278 RepID=A0A9X2AMF4_9BURK|nr:mechanosensitive ion channel domain-containing protein [Variovorax terrae]MCJ0762710.1 mechanosensitive ion channel [Variovorax terrae]
MIMPSLLTELVSDARANGLWLEALVLVLSLVAGIAIQRGIMRSYPGTPRRKFDLVIPMVMSLGVFFGQSVLALTEKVPLLKLSLAVLLAWLFSRFIARLLTGMFPQSPTARWMSRVLRWGGWLVAVLIISDWLGIITTYLDSIYLPIGKHRTSLQSLLEGGIGVLVTLLVALWLSSALEARLMKSQFIEMNLRLVLSKLLRSVLLVVGVLLALSVAGIDLTVLSVFGGALGVGLGLGLQKLAANYVSGFVILLERSVKVGDNVRVDNFEGQVTAIRTRYTLVQASNGREAIVPNETLTSNRVENLSLANSNLLVSMVVSCGYESDVDRALAILMEAAQAQPRVLKAPGPTAVISAFAADGIELTLMFWIADPENGQASLKGAVFRQTWAQFQREGIDVPYPQRVLRMQQPVRVEPVAAAAPPADGPADQPLPKPR